MPDIGPLDEDEIERSRHAHERPGFLSVHTVDRWLATIDAKDDEIRRLSQELKAAREELESLESLPGLKRALIAERKAAAAEAESNRYQMQYEEECEVHGDTRAGTEVLTGLILRLDWSNIHTHYPYSACADCATFAALAEPEETK